MAIEDQKKNYNMILVEKLQKYQLYHQAKSINMNFLLVKEYCHAINIKIIEKAKFYLFSFGKGF